LAIKLKVSERPQFGNFKVIGSYRNFKDNWFIDNWDSIEIFICAPEHGRFAEHIGSSIWYKPPSILIIELSSQCLTS
jgi:hypothetical protein